MDLGMRVLDVSTFVSGEEYDMQGTESYSQFSISQELILPDNPYP
jgi:hypothetical protein